jgi:anti-anti-sigma factor
VRLDVDGSTRTSAARFDVERGQGWAVVAVRGELDVASATNLEGIIAGLLAAQTDDLVLDLSDTWFCDSAGLRVLLDTHARFLHRGGTLLLRAPTHHVRQLLEITGLLDHFGIED